MAAPISSTPFQGRWRGLWSRTQEVDVDPMYAREAKNVDFYGNVIAKRAGTKKVLLNPCGSSGKRRVNGIHNARFRDGTNQTIVAAGDKLQKIANGGAFVDPPTDLPASLPSGTPARVGAAPTLLSMLNNLVFIVDGVDLDEKWDGTTLWKMGIAAPTVAPSIVTVAVGLTGTVGYRYTYLNALNVESEGSAETKVTLANQKARVTATASIDPQVTKTRLYRTTIGGGGIWLFVSEIGTNGGTFPDDAAADATLGTQMEEFVNNPPPGPLKIIALWPQAGRLAAVSAAFPNIVAFSDVGLGFLKPEAWPPENLILVNLDDGDEIVAIHALFDSLLVQKRHSTWRVTGIPPDIRLEPVHFDEDRTAIGGFSQRGILGIDNDLFLPGPDGAYSASHAAFAYGGFSSERISRDIDLLWGQIPIAQGTLVHGVFFRTRRQALLWVPFGVGVDPDRCFVFQLDATPDGRPNGWSWWDVPATASAIIDLGSGPLVYIGRADGFIELMHQAAEDHWTGSTPGNGVAYDYEYDMQPFAPANEAFVDVRGRRIDLVAEVSAPSTLLITPQTDHGTDWAPVSLTLAPMGTFLLDSDPASVPGAGILGDVDAFGQPSGGTPMGAVIPKTYPCVFLSRGRYHGARIMNVEKGAAFAIHQIIYRWQALPLKSSEPAAVQMLG